MFKKNVKMLHLFDMLLMLTFLLIIVIACFQYEWPHRLVLITIIIALFLTLFLDKKVDKYLVFFLGIFTYPVFAPFYCKILGGDYYSYNNHWLQFENDLNNIALIYVTIPLCLSWIYLKVRRRKYVVNSNVAVLNENSIFLYLFSIIAFLFLFYLAEPGDLLITSDYMTILGQRIKGTQFAGGAGTVFFVLSSIFYSSLQNKKSNILYFANKFYILSAIITALWLFFHARRSELLGILAIYIFILENNKSRKLIIGCTVLLAMIVIGIVRENVVTMASVLNVFSKDDNLAAIKYVALPGGGSNIYLTLIDIIHYVSLNGFTPDKLFINLAGIMPSFILKWFGIQEYFTFSSIINTNYVYNGGLYFPVVFYYSFSFFAGCLLLSMSLIFLMKIIILSSSTNNLSFKMAGYTLIFYSARIFWYEPIGSLKFVFYAYLIGFFVAKIYPLNTKN